LFEKKVKSLIKEEMRKEKKVSWPSLLKNGFVSICCFSYL